MTSHSMTGFASVEGSNKNARWNWEVRSLNGKGLDFRLRIPPGCEHLQPQIRNLVTKKFCRGNLQIKLTLERGENKTVPVVNQEALDAVIIAIAKLQREIKCVPPAAEQILAIKGIMDSSDFEESEFERVTLSKSVIEDFKKLLSELKISRAGEGAMISQIVIDHLAVLEKIVMGVANDTSRHPEQIKKRLNKQISQYLDTTSGLDLDRLHQEAAILATKADLCEEIDRLNVHINSARKLLSSEGPIGRKLEFICQEFNRECNTICSKSNATSITAAGLEMKIVIDQLREQVQNLE